MRKWSAALLVAAMFVADVAVVPGTAEAETPLLYKDTKTIFERVLTRPGQSLFDEPDGKKVKPLWPLQPVYVFERSGGWLRVGRSDRESEGWIVEADTAPWVHNIVGAFTARGTSRPRQLIFETADKMQEVLDHESYLDLLAKYREEAAKGGSSEDSGVLTIEKELFVDIGNSFYLMPITDFQERRIGFGGKRKALYLELASVPLNSVTTSAVDAEFDVGIVFVIDTTQSMKPFIPETLSAVEEIVEKLHQQDEEGAISFGLVGFRDDPEGRPGTEYRVKEYVPLRPDSSPEAILNGLQEMRAMQTSTWGFPEDSLAGLDYAIENTVWKKEDEYDFAARMIILITDAPPKPPNDPHAETSRNAQTVAENAIKKNVGIATIFIESRSGRDYVEFAEEDYRTLSRFRSIPTEMYYPVDARDPAGFRDKIRDVIGNLVGNVNEEVDVSRDNADDSDVDMSDVGLAMRLAYLGRLTGQDAPAILRGWTMDRSLEEWRELAIEPRVLVTRNQLTSMADIMRGIIDEAEEGAKTGKQDNFFENVRDVVVGVGADSQRLVNSGADNLGGMIGEFLEYLPYVADRRLMSITQRDWQNDPGLRLATVEDLKAKLEFYQDLYSAKENWTELYQGQPEGEHVYAIRLDALP